MSGTWKITILAERETIEAALLAHEKAPAWDFDITLAGSEVSSEDPNRWQLEAWLSREPRDSDRKAVAALFGDKPLAMQVESVAEADWLTLSQAGLAPIRAGRFHVRTPDHPPVDEPGITDFCIPAGQAFGTGHHETTAGCLVMLTKMKRSGVQVRNCADIGTGTGLLAFAALDLWPRAIVTASDIDPICAGAVIDNAQRNGIRIGAAGGELTVTIADGMNHPLIQARGPYDLVMANILAGPLIEMAPIFSAALVPGGNLLLAGLTRSQESAVRAACRRAGFRLAARITSGDWSILWLRKRGSPRLQRIANRNLDNPPSWLRRWAGAA